VTYPEMSAIPFSRPSKVIAVGLNYGRHATEAYVDVLPWPVTFARFPSRLIDTGEPIRIPPGSVTVDDEAELAVVMGKTTRSVSRDDVLAYTAGYMCLNDITDCDTRTREGQCPGNKSFDNTSEISDPQSLAIRARLNGQGVQDASTSQMILSVAVLITFLSQRIMPESGDVIAAGTPSGMGAFRDPPVYLKPGDQFAIEMKGIGILSNPLVASD
jgi:acylpyruvate hydrolase